MSISGLNSVVEKCIFQVRSGRAYISGSVCGYLPCPRSQKYCTCSRDGVLRCVLKPPSPHRYASRPMTATPEGSFSFIAYESVGKHDSCSNLPSESTAGHLKTTAQPVIVYKECEKNDKTALFSMLFLIFIEYFKVIFIPYFLVFVVIE